MADLARLEQALISADKAGDAQGASLIAGEIRRLRSQSRQPDALDNPNMAVEGMSGFDRVAAGAGQAVANLGRGVGQKLGMVSTDEIASARATDAPLLDTPGGFAGSIAGNIAMTLLPGSALRGVGQAMASPAIAGIGNAILAPKTLGQAAAVGGAIGAAQPAVDGGEFLRNTGLGAGLSAGITGVGKMLQTPNVRPEVRALQDEGITPTMGQILGGRAKSVEDKLTSVPILGDAITGARRSGVEQLNRAAINRAVAPIGQQIDEVGREGVLKAQKALSEAYDTLLPQMKFQADGQFNREMMNLGRLTSGLPKEDAKAFTSIVNREVKDRLTKSGLASGETLKTIESELRKQAERYATSTTARERQIGDALTEALAVFRRGVERSNPQLADQLKAINQGYANLTRVEVAASRTGSKEGVFSPAALSGAVKQGDKTARDRAFASGRAFMQDLSDPAEAVLGAGYPDSGTAGRMLLNAGALGSGAISPMIPAGLGLLSIPYLPGVRNATAGLLTGTRPQAVNAIGRAVPYAAPLLVGPGLSQIP